MARKANELAGKYGFAADETDDIRQELSLHLLRHWASYDETKGKVTTFIQNAVDGKVCVMIRDQRRAKRDSRRERSLSQVEDAIEFGKLDGVRGQPEISDLSLVELRSDCDDIVGNLPPQLREIADLLKLNSPAEVARQLDIPKTTFWRRMTELRKHFVAAGFGDA
ncbi:MAG: sigma factor [Planctomycetia bacterium]